MAERGLLDAGLQASREQAAAAQRSLSAVRAAADALASSQASAETSAAAAAERTLAATEQLSPRDLFVLGVRGLLVDALEESMRVALTLAEVTERRLECLERGEKLPEPLRNLPPVQISAQAIVARLRGGEAEEAPELLELTLLPESRASQLRRAELLVPSPAQLQRIARERAPELLEKGEELLERAPSSSTRSRAACSAWRRTRSRARGAGSESGEAFSRSI